MIELDIIGQCPPSPYRGDDPIRNPYYYVYGPGSLEGLNLLSPPALDVSYDDDDSDDGDTNSLIPSQDASSLFSFGDGDTEAVNDSQLNPSENMLPSNEDSLFSIDTGLTDISFAPSDVFGDLV